MAASPAASTTLPSRALGERYSLLDFLRRELAPFPGRGVATCRIVVASVVVLVLCMTLRVPEAHLAVWIVLRISTEESGETLMFGVVAVVAITVAVILSLVLLFVAMDQHWLRFCLIGVMAGVALFLRRTFVIGAAGFVLGLIPAVVLTAPDFIPAPDPMVRLTLWMWSVFGLGIAGAVGANLLIAPTDPAELLRDELVGRVRAAEGAIARRLGRSTDEPQTRRFATAGIARQLALLRSAGVLHPSVRSRHAQQSALITLADRLVTAAAVLEVLSLVPSADERERLESLDAACARVQRALEDGRTLPPTPPIPDPAIPGARASAMLPVIAELEHVVTLFQQALGPEAVIAAAPAPERRILFVADALTNPEYVRYALKGALAVMICYLLQSAVDWPGIRTCIITCMIVGLTSEGATIQKGTLRMAGAVVGGALGFLAIMLVIPSAESITSMALLVAAGSAVAAWVFVGSARISYAGVQIAFAFYVCVIQGFEPSWYFYTIRDRMIGILLGNAVITWVFLSVWPVRAGAAMWASLGSALRAMADLARVGSRSDDQAVVAREVQGLRELAYRHFATAQQSAEEEAFEWRASGPDVDAARGRFQAATTEAQAVFLTQLAIASQRPNVAPAELSESLVAGTRRFDAAVAESLDVIADRAQGAPFRDTPDLRAPLAAVTALMRGEIPRIANPEVAVQVEGRMALYRELVPRLERLGSGSFIG